MQTFLERLKLPGPAWRRQLFLDEWRLFCLLETALVLLAAGWISLTPPGFLGKLWAIAYSSCHQISARSLFHADHQAPFCARCTGMHLGAGLGLLFLALKKRRISWPRPGILAVLGAFLVFFALDGLNSFAQFLPGKWQVYESSNTLRLLSGLGMGLGIAVIAFPIFNRAFWEDGSADPLLSWPGLAAVLVLLAAVAAAVLSGWGLALLFSFVFTPLSFAVLLILLYTSLVLVLLRQDGESQHWWQLHGHLLLGALLAMIQMSAIALIRYQLTGTWAPMNL